MTFRTDLKAFLDADIDLKALVGNRIRPVVGEASDPTPYITYATVSNPAMYHMGGTTSLTTETIQFSSWGKTADEAFAVGEQLRKTLEGLRGRVGETFIQGAFLQNEIDLERPPSDGSQKYYISRMSTYDFTYKRVDPGSLPVFTTDPEITGYNEVGQVLTSTYGVADGGGPIEYDIQWYRDNILIVGETSTTYTQAFSDIGSVFTTKSTATNPAGTAEADSNEVTTVDPYFGPLDVLEDAGLDVAFAYGLNGLSKDYTGDVVEAYNGSTTELIGVLEHDFDSAAFNTFAPSGGYAQGLIDQTGNANPCNQPNTAKQAEIIPDAMGGRYGLDLNGVKSWIMDGISETANDWTFFCAAKQKSDTATTTILFESLTGRFILYANAQYGGGDGYGFRQGSQTKLGGRVFNNENIFEYIFDNSQNSSVVAIDRYDQVVGNYGTQLGLGGETQLGSSWNDTEAARTKMDMVAFIGVQGAVSDTTREKVRQSFAEYFSDMNKEVIAFRVQSNGQGADVLGNNTPLPAVGKSYAYNVATDVNDVVSDPMPNSGDTLGTATANSSPLPQFCETANTLGIPFAPVIAERGYGGTTEINFSTPNWSASSTLQQEFIDTTNAACAKIRKDQPKAVISIIGETDEANIDTAQYTGQQYEDALRANLLALRAEWDQVIVVIAQTTWRGSAGDTAGAQAVRAAQQQMADDYSWCHISTISSTFHANGWILDQGGAYVHWSWEACNASGEDLATVLNGVI